MGQTCTVGNVFPFLYFLFLGSFPCNLFSIMELCQSKESNNIMIKECNIAIRVHFALLKSLVTLIFYKHSIAMNNYFYDIYF